VLLVFITGVRAFGKPKDETQRAQRITHAKPQFQSPLFKAGRLHLFAMVVLGGLDKIFAEGL
jgi:hypothetical protein